MEMNIDGQCVLVVGKCVLVVGMGKSGFAATNLLMKHGAKVVLYDGKTDVDLENINDAQLPFGKPMFALGNVDEETMNRVQLAVFSPGVPLDISLAERCREKNIPIWGEIELAYQFEQGTIIGITGTNGKTTTTALVGEIMKTRFTNTFVVGNIGEPYTKKVEETTNESVTVAEISSFQLETVNDFHPHVSAILNITPDHLNRHKTMENYANTKGIITKNQTEKDMCILNANDVYSEQFANNTKAQVYYFSSRGKVSQGVYLDDQLNICISMRGIESVLCNVKEMKLLGVHNYENVMAAVAMAVCMDVPVEKIKEAVLSYQGVEHRIEFVVEKNGIFYYNDSKGTNPDAAIKAVEAMIRPTILIGGGYDKDSEYKEWIESFDGTVKDLILFGATKYKIAEAAKKCGFHKVYIVNNLEEAVNQANELAESGDAILLSPACASWDMFTSFEERGNMFKEYVLR